MIDTLLPKLVLTPALITFATLLGRRYGQAIAGWLIAFPWTSAPVSFFLALDHGLPFAAAAAHGSVASVASGSAYALVFARVERGWRWSLIAASAAYGLVAVLMQFATVPVVPLALGMGVVLLVARRLMPPPSSGAAPARVLPTWDLPARVSIATGLVLAITLVAPLLGPYGSAALATFPLFASILGVFAERHGGHGAAVDVMRGLVTGLFGFTAFFVVVDLTLESLGVAATYGLAVVTVVAVQAVALAVLRRAPPEMAAVG